MTTYLLSLIAVGAVLAIALLAGCSSNKSGSQVSMGAKTEGGYICPLTGEELPCPKCCPLNKKN